MLCIARRQSNISFALKIYVVLLDYYMHYNDTYHLYKLKTKKKNKVKGRRSHHVDKDPQRRACAVRFATRSDLRVCAKWLWPKYQNNSIKGWKCSVKSEHGTISEVSFIKREWGRCLSKKTYTLEASRLVCWTSDDVRPARRRSFRAWEWQWMENSAARGSFDLLGNCSESLLLRFTPKNQSSWNRWRENCVNLPLVDVSHSGGDGGWRREVGGGFRCWLWSILNSPLCKKQEKESCFEIPHNGMHLLFFPRPISEYLPLNTESAAMVLYEIPAALSVNQWGWERGRKKRGLLHYRTWR